MAGGFKSALLEKERERQLLAETLQANFAAEGRNARIRGFLILGVGLFVALKVLGGGKDAIDSLERVRSGKAAPAVKNARSTVEIMASVKQQMRDRDQLLLGTEAGPPEGSAEVAVPDAERHPAGSGIASRDAEPEELSSVPAYAESRIPLNLFGDLNSRRPARAGRRPEFALPSEGQRQKAEEGPRRMGRAPWIGAGMYRPGVVRDLRKLPSRFRPEAAPPGTSDYRPLPAPPVRLAGDSGAFPAKN